MCGIVGVFHTGDNKMPVNDAVLNQFEDQQSRGTQGFGIIKIGESMEYKIDRATEGYKFMYDIHQDPVRGMILHHRTPTSSDNRLNQTHPIEVNNGSLKHKYFVVHNGIINNDDELKEAHEKLGFQYVTEYKDKTKYNDSECLAIEVARFIEGQISRLEVQGSAAFICLQVSKKTNRVLKLFFGRNTNPLHMAKTRGKLFLSSAGQGDAIEADTLYECRLDEEMKLNKRKMLFKEYEVKKAVTVTGFNYNVKDVWGDRNSDFREHRLYKNLHKNEDLPPDEDEAEQTPVEMAVEDKAEEINTTLDSFFDMLYNEYQINHLTDKDIDLTLESIRISLKEAIDEAKTAYMEEAIKNDYTPVTS
jgi:predicted glutamine amidotransferase